MNHECNSHDILLCSQFRNEQHLVLRKEHSSFQRQPTNAHSSLVVLVGLRCQVTCLEEFGWSVAQHVLEITNKPIDVAFASCLVDNILVVVISQAPTQLLIVHLRLVFTDTPAPRHLIGVGQLELPVSAGPADEGLACLVC